MPTNLYGQNDNFHVHDSHVIPALIRRFHQAKIDGDAIVTAWGSGSPKREFLYVDDMADASIFVMNLDQISYSKATQATLSHINVGSGIDCSIGDLVRTISKVVGYQGVIEFDKSKPDGAPRKLMDTTKLNQLNWRATTDLETGLMKTYNWFLENQGSYRS
jgi:GDP-L-fucose synthase